MALQARRSCLLLLKIELFLVIQMLQAESIIMSIEKGRLSLLRISIMASKVDRFLFLEGQMSSQDVAEKGHDQNRCDKVSS
jgi:hypothetical protein